MLDRKGGAAITAGALVMVGLRAADPFIQYKFLHDGYAASFLTKVLRVPAKYAITPALYAVPPFARFDLGSLNETSAVVLGMTGVAALRHIYWALYTRGYYFSPADGAFVGVYNLVLNAINSLVLLATASRFPLASQKLGWKQYLGIAMFTAGMALELIPEQTRYNFKAKAENKGKIDDTGMWGVIRHPNFAGYSLWRAGLALSTGSVLNAVLQGLYQIASFTFGSIPQLDSQMSKKYKGDWEEYKRRVPYALVPGVY